MFIKLFTSQNQLKFCTDPLYNSKDLSDRLLFSLLALYDITHYNLYDFTRNNEQMNFEILSKFNVVLTFEKSRNICARVDFFLKKNFDF